MIDLDVDPKLVFGFFDHGRVSKSMHDAIVTNGWCLPRVPVFEIPAHVADGHRYMLADGNTRRNVAEYLQRTLPVRIFDAHERIITDGTLIAHFRHSSDPMLYQKLLLIYQRKIVR
ncbi:MAG TPA: hypothetical protein VK158_03265 [Acidobacteriota bacterium]|nr:hypothetical protein [Acidobacteriota bacterium]